MPIRTFIFSVVMEILGISTGTTENCSFILLYLLLKERAHTLQDMRLSSVCSCLKMMDVLLPFVSDSIMLESRRKIFFFIP